MAEPDNTPKPPRYPRPPQQPPGGGDGMNWRGLIFIALAVLMLSTLFLSQRNGLLQNRKELAYSPEFVEAVEQGRIVSARIVSDNSTGEQYVEGKYLPEKDKPEVDYKVTVALDFNRNLETFLRENKVKFTVGYNHGLLTSALINIGMLLFVGLLIFFLFRQQLRSSGRSAFNFGKIRGKMVQKDKNKIMFKDVAGVEEAKEEVQEIVDFLKDPRRFQKLGGRIPKGVLLIGPPGTGKTLLAKAIAGEADVPFFSISGSDFVEMFVGVGASRVRDMFEQGKKSAPCLIFIDEIDAVGRSRGHGVGGGNDEREQTLNALLVEMDGFDSQEGIIIIAATNRKDVLDPALLRPGRFDREVFVSLPDIRGREEILKVHTRTVKIAAEVDLTVVARGTPGFSGAELANLVNEAALLAAKNGHTAVMQADLEEARDKVSWGKERRSLKRTEDEIRKTAFHEAGHALLNVLLEYTDPLHKVTIIPRGQALGVTMMLPESDKHNYYRKRIVDDLCVIMGGRVAEEVFLGDISSGAAGDIRQATWYARKMVCDWGMSDKAGMVGYSDNDEYVFLGRDIGRGRTYSEATQQMLDAEVKVFIDDAYSRAKTLIETHREKLVAIAEALIEFETLDGAQVKELVEHGRLLNPPTKPEPPSPEPPSTEEAAPRKSGKKEGGFDLPGGLQPSPVGA